MREWDCPTFEVNYFTKTRSLCPGLVIFHRLVFALNAELAREAIDAEVL